jgi:hypothetical protein
MLASKIKFVLIAASLLILGSAACKWEPPGGECRAKEGCQCIADCESELPNPG